MADDAPTPYKASPLTITIVVTVGLAVLAAFWQLSDPRNEIKNIREGYLSVREHNEFAARIAADIKRLEDENRRQMTVETFRAWKDERDGVIRQLTERAGRAITQTEVQEVWRGFRAELDNLHRQIEQMRDMILNHERDDRRLMYPPRSTATQPGNQGKP